METGYQTLYSFEISAWFYYLVFAIFFVLVFSFFRNLLRKYLDSLHYFDHTVYSVRLPKEKPGDQQKEFTVQTLREEIAKGETIFASVGSLKAQRTLKSYIMGRNDHFSFEIVAHKKKIAFYVVAPRNMGRYLEQSINAQYPDAVIEEVTDYNIFMPTSEIVAGSLKTRRHCVYPLKTYQKMEIDPMNSVINVMSKLNENEGMAIQFIARSAKKGWHRKVFLIRRKLRQTNSITQALYVVNLNPVSYYLREIFHLMDSGKNKSQNNFSSQNSMYRMTHMEEEMMKGIEEKNSKAGLDVNLRVIVSTAEKGKAQLYLSNLSNAFGQYNYYEYGNSFNSSINTRGQRKIVEDFIYRKFDSNLSFLLNTEELAGLYHLPLKNAETPNILWLTAKHGAAPAEIPQEGILLGQNIYRGEVKEVRIKRDDRRRHMYIVGKSGVGKSVFIANMAVQDIMNGEGVCIIDPHGDLISDILKRVPPERAEDVVLFAPADIERPLALNLLEFDPRYPEQKTFVINEMIKIFDKLYDLKSTGGPIFEQYMRNSMLLIMSDPESGSTLMEIPKVLANPEFRKKKLEKCNDPTVIDFWKQEAEKAGGDAALANVVPYITSKLNQFISNDTMRPIIGQQKSSFNLRDIMDKKKILLVDLSKGQVGELNAHLLGMILVGKILMAALSRTDVDKEARKDFYLYIDEFQNFTTDSICSILSEARKYGLNLIVAHQYLGQLVKGQDSSIKDAVFGNVGTWVVFKVGSEDAEVIQKEFNPVFNQYDLINVENATAYVKLLINNTSSRPFSMHAMWPIFGVKRDEIASKIKALSRLKFGQDRSIIEAEIRRRTRI